MIWLSTQQIILMHELLIKQTGGMGGIKSKSLLDSAINAPYQTFDGGELYPTVQKKAACLCYSLVNNHAFNDGNKRVGVLAMLVLLELNGVKVDCVNSDLVNLGLGVASGKYTQQDILDWIVYKS